VLSKSFTADIDDVVDRVAAIEARLRAMKINNFTTTRQMAALDVHRLTSTELFDPRRAHTIWTVST